MQNIDLKSICQDFKSYLIQHHPKHCLILAGSFSLGTNDSFSDLDFWVMLPDDQVNEQTKAEFARLCEINRINDIVLWDKTKAGYALYGHYRNFKLDLNIYSESATKKVFHNLLVELQPSIIHQRLLTLWQEATQISNTMDIQDFVRQCHIYPDELQLKVVESGLRGLPHPEVFEKHFLRKDYLSFASNISNFFIRVVLLIYALNKQHAGRVKKAETDLNRFKIKPANFIERMNQALMNPNEKTTAECIKIYHEVADLIRVQLPSINVDQIVEEHKKREPQ